MLFYCYLDSDQGGVVEKQQSCANEEEFLHEPSLGSRIRRMWLAIQKRKTAASYAYSGGDHAYTHQGGSPRNQSTVACSRGSCRCPAAGWRHGYRIFSKGDDRSTARGRS